MADTPRSRVSRLEETLKAKPHRYDFFQALRLLERQYLDTPRLGRAKRAAEEPIRVGQEPYLAFPPATLSSFTPTKDDQPAKLGVRFFGVFGPQGALPIHLTSYAKRRLEQERDPTFSRFVDIFHHRLLLLFYRAWADSQPAVDYDRPTEARFTRYVGSLAGSGAKSPDAGASSAWMQHAELFHIGYLSSGTRHASGLKGLLEETFEAPFHITPFVGDWLRLPKNTLLQLGRRGALGVDTVAGEYSFQRQHRFRIALGPLDLETFKRFMPGSPSLQRLAKIVRRAVGDELEWDLKLILKHSEVPRASLNGKTRLGMTSWSGDEKRRIDAEDLVLHVDQMRETERAHAHR